MKVYLGPFKYWVGPYQIAKIILFWIPEYDKDYNSNRTVHNFGKWLATKKDGSPSLLANFCEWVESKRSRKVKVCIDDYDTFNADATMTYIILPLLKKIREDKNGYPYVKMEDVPEKLRVENVENLFDDNDTTLHERWDWVLNEMIWAFEQIHPDSPDWEAQYSSGKISLRHEPVKFDEDGNPALYQIMKNEDHTSKFDSEGYKLHRDRIDNGLILFGKYYQSLWT